MVAGRKPRLTLKRDLALVFSHPPRLFYNLAPSPEFYFKSISLSMFHSSSSAQPSCTDSSPACVSSILHGSVGRDFPGICSSLYIATNSVLFELSLLIRRSEFANEIARNRRLNAEHRTADAPYHSGSDSDQWDI